MRPCDRCGTELEPGSAHFDADSCIAALKHRLNCLECGQPVPKPFHGACFPRAVAKGGAGVGMSILERKAREAVEGFLSRPKDPPPSGSGGKRASDRS